MQMKKSISLMLVALAGACFLVAGCGRDNLSENSPASLAAPVIAGGAAPQLKLSDFPAELNLTTAQQTQMQAALNTLGQAQGQRMAAGQRMAHAQGTGPGSFRGAAASGQKPPMMAFLEATSQILTPDQFLVLAHYLADRRASMQSQMGGHGRWRGAGGGPGGGAGMMAKKLGLSADQISRLQTVRQAQETKHQEMWTALRSGQITADQALAQVKSMRADMETSTQQVLTADQLAAMEKARADRKSKMQTTAGKQNAGNQGSTSLTQRVDDRAAFLGRILGLNDTQAAQVKQVLEGTVPQRQSLTQEIGSGALQPEEIGIKVWQIEKNASTQIRAGLTQEQAQRFDALIALLPQGPRGGM